MTEYVREKLKEVFEATVDSGLKYEGQTANPEKLDYFGLFCKASAENQMHKVMGNNLCMFNCKYEDKDSIMVIFSIPINNPEESGSKNVAERVMEVVSETESCFITLDYIKSFEVKEDKFIYVTIFKKLNGG
ncbi:MAG: hypothetical protein PVG65_01965 [Candidatus Thorarchaeota archaeon]|jgi:hypothetical protein